MRAGDTLGFCNTHGPSCVKQSLDAEVVGELLARNESGVRSSHLKWSTRRRNHCLELQVGNLAGDS